MRSNIPKVKDFGVFILVFLIISSTVTFPALAAGQLGENSVEAPHIGILNWLRNLLRRFFGSTAPEPLITNSGGLSTADFTWSLSSSPDVSNPGGVMISSILDLALSAIDYRDNFNNNTKRVNFVETGRVSITAIDGFMESTMDSDSPLAIELRLKLVDFKREIETTLTNAEMGKVTQDELNQLIDSVSDATGRRYEKVTFDRYEEREIYPRVLGAGGEVTVHNGELTLPGGVNSSTPLPEDYLPDIDTNITPEIRALADKLDNDSARIYWWVHENIRYAPYYGAMHGAEQTLISRSGNDVDTAILTVALLRAAGYPARYVYGEAYATRDEVFDLLGVSDVPGALRLLWGTGIPAEFDGVGFRLERVWVETYAPIYPGTRPLWIQLDPSWKTATPYTKTDEYISVNSTVNATELQNGATANATINESEGYIQGINTTFIEEYLNSHINVTELQNISEEFFIPEEVMPPEEVYLPLSMQFEYNRSYEYSNLPSALKWKINLELTTTIDTTYAGYNLTEIAGLPFAIDFTPTTANDSVKMQNSSIPAYEINVTPQIWLNTTHVNGTPVPYGSEVAVQFSMTMIDTTTVSKWLYAGEKSAIVIDAPKTEYVVYNKTLERFNILKDSGENDTLAREGLFLIGQDFFFSTDLSSDRLSETQGLKWARIKPAVLFVSKENQVESFNGVPINVFNGGTSMDLKFDQIVTSADRDNAALYNLGRGFIVSEFEGTTLGAYYANTTGISTIHILNKALEENVTVYFVSNDSIDRLDNLSISEGDKEIIRSLLQQSASYFVIILLNSSNVGNWTGTGYAVIDKETGEAKFLISGGLNGGGTDRITDKIPSVDWCRLYEATTILCRMELSLLASYYTFVILAPPPMRVKLLIAGGTILTNPGFLLFFGSFQATVLLTSGVATWKCKGSDLNMEDLLCFASSVP